MFAPRAHRRLPSERALDLHHACPHDRSINEVGSLYFIFVQTEGGADILGISPTGVFQNEAGPDNAANSPKGPVRFAEEEVTVISGGNQTWVSSRWGGGPRNWISI